MICKCGNEARYVDARGETCCALCPLREGIESWRIADVPEIIGRLKREIKFVRWSHVHDDGLDLPRKRYEEHIDTLPPGKTCNLFSDALKDFDQMRAERNELRLRLDEANRRTL